MKIILVIAAGGALGAVARYAVMVGAGHWAGFSSPYGTMAVNILGSFLLGALMEIIALFWTPSEEMRVFLVVGVWVALRRFRVFLLILFCSFKEMSWGSPHFMLEAL